MSVIKILTPVGLTSSEWNEINKLRQVRTFHGCSHPIAHKPRKSLQSCWTISRRNGVTKLSHSLLSLSLSGADDLKDKPRSRSRVSTEILESIASLGCFRMEF